MIDTNNTISALRMLGLKMSSIAGNIANVASDNYKKTTATLTEGDAPGSVGIDIVRNEAPGHKVYEPHGGELLERELSNVNIVEECAKSITTRNSFEANLKYLQTVDEMLGKVIDTLG